MSRLLGLLILGCGPPAPLSGDTENDSDVEYGGIVETCSLPLSCTVGIGEEAFNMPIQLVHGPQGGWHVNVALRARHTTQVVHILPILTDPATHTILSGGGGLADTYNQALIMEGECTGKSSGIRAILDGFDLPRICALQGQELELQLQVRDQKGTSASCMTTGIVALDPEDIPLCEAL